MIVELLICALVLGTAIWLASKSNDFSFEIPVPEQKEELNAPQRMRRVQQALKRQFLDYKEWESSLAHETKELSIANQMLSLGEKNLEVNTNILKLNETGLDLQAREIQLQHGLNMLQAGNQELGLDKKLLEIAAQSKELELDATANQLNDEKRLLEIQTAAKDLEFNEREQVLEQAQRLLEITSASKDLEFNERKQVLEHGKRLLELSQIDLSQQERAIELKDKESEVSHSNRLLTIVGEHLKLRKEKLDIQDYHNAVKQEGRMVQLGKKELALDYKALHHAYNVKSFQLQTMLQDIRHQFSNLQLEKKAFSLMKERSSLDLYHNRLRDLETHINQMYEVKHNWLRLEAKENDLDNREERLRLQRLYDSTQHKMQELSITRREVNHLWDKRAIEHRSNILKFIGKNW